MLGNPRNSSSRITDKFSWCWFVGGEFVMSLFAHGASVLAGQQTLVVQRADLSHQCPRNSSSVRQLPAYTKSAPGGHPGAGLYGRWVQLNS